MPQAGLWLVFGASGGSRQNGDAGDVDLARGGAWEIETFADRTYHLVVPQDGRATITELAGPAREADGEPAELLACGRYDEGTGMAAGATVGERMLLTFEPATADGTYVTYLTQKVVYILQVEEARQAAQLEASPVPPGQETHRGTDRRREKVCTA